MRIPINRHLLVRYLRWEIHGERTPRSRRWPRRGPARSWRYKGWIRTLPSVVSGRLGCEAAHTQNNGMRSKGSDFSCVPLTPEEHREYDAGRVAFERKYDLAMTAVVRKLNGLWFSYGGQVK